jgi:hypothetical protein
MNPGSVPKSQGPGTLFKFIYENLIRTDLFPSGGRAASDQVGICRWGPACSRAISKIPLKL